MEAINRPASHAAASTASTLPPGEELVSARSRHARRLFAGIAQWYEWVATILSFGQDVQGYSTDSTMVEGRLTGGVALRAVYLRRLFVEAGATWYRRNTEFDPLRDRGNYTLAAGVTF